ncbi:hypothetical protein Dred_2455 [Desulforamulus reducens MI-1]|uniref:Uncharacterized protein n=2 Tax=Desulforamulus TaxID=2916693 RepID=A4J7B2_DESRM|nr:hypothetical protein Dred_2455 [Desulforamulus reducens MI-1]
MPMVAPTFIQRLCQLLHMRVTVFLNCEEATAPLTGTLHAVGQDYIELVNGPTNQTQATIIPLWNICTINVAGAMNDVCPPPQPYPYQPQYPVSPGQDMMPGCPMPGPGPMPGCPKPGAGHDCTSMQPPGWAAPAPGFMDVKKEKEEK